MEIVLKNMMEPLVLDKINDTISQFGCCTCEVCKMDIASLALNKVPPRYVATHMGEMYTKLEALSVQYGADVLNAITSSVNAVKENPRHPVPVE